MKGEKNSIGVVLVEESYYAMKEAFCKPGGIAGSGVFGRGTQHN